MIILCPEIVDFRPHWLIFQHVTWPRNVHVYS